jgi:hypothetical protein
MTPLEGPRRKIGFEVTEKPAGMGKGRRQRRDKLGSLGAEISYTPCTDVHKIVDEAVIQMSH